MNPYINLVMVTQYSVKNTKYFPELLISTYTNASLPTGQTTILELDDINSNNQVALIQKIGSDFSSAGSGLFLSQEYWKSKTDINLSYQNIYTNDLVGIGQWLEVFGGHPFGYAPYKYKLNAINSTGAGVTNYRSGIQYIVHDLTTFDKMILGVDTNSRDRESWKAVIKAGYDPETTFIRGVGIPADLGPFLEEHQVFRAIPLGAPQGINLSSTASTIVNLSPSNIGSKSLVLERIYVQRPAQANIGQVTVSVFRDNESTAICSFDPACLPDVAKPNAETVVNGLPFMDFHIHSFENIQIQASASSGTYNNFQLIGIFSERHIGLDWKARMQEFSSLPNVLDITSKEQEIIDRLLLKERLRVGLIGSG